MKKFLLMQGFADLAIAHATGYQLLHVAAVACFACVMVQLVIDAFRNKS